jgi:hypothetical protein
MRDETPPESNNSSGEAVDGWLKSSFSMSNGQCVEIGRLKDGRIGMRDSKVANGPVLRFEQEVFAAFLRDLRDPRSPSSLGH